MMHHLLLLCLLLVTGRTTHAQSNNNRNRQIQRYPLPAFSMLLKVRVDEVSADDDAQVYLDLQVFQETLERVTQLHLTDVFQQAEGRVEFDERFLRVQLSSKVRQDMGVEPDHHHAQQRVHVPLHAGFSGVVSYSFPEGVLPSEDRVDMLVEELLQSALVAENYMLLFRRYLSSGVLADIEDVQDIRIGTQLLNVAETPPPKHEEHVYDATIDHTTQNKNSHKKHLNAVTIVAIVIFLTLSCLLMLFGATVVLLMKDRARQEEKYTGQTMTSIGMGTNKKKKEPTLTEDEGDNDSNDDDEDTAVTTTPAWKRAVLPVLRKAVMVRRYWRKHVRKHKSRPNAAPTTPVADNPNEAASAANFEHEDDGLNDEDVYYDENLSDEEAASRWLDAWQASITSIPVRTIASSRQVPPGSSPNKRKKKKQSKAPLAPHPAKRQSKKAFLCCIAEEDSVVETNSIMDPDDLELGASPRNAVGSPRNGTGKNNNTTKICLELDRIQELASVIMEEEYPKKVPVSSPANSLSPRSPDTPAALVTSASFPGAYNQSSKKKSHTGFDEGDYEGLERIQDVDLS